MYIEYTQLCSLTRTTTLFVFCVNNRTLLRAKNAYLIYFYMYIHYNFYIAAIQAILKLRMFDDCVHSE